MAEVEGLGNEVSHSVEWHTIQTFVFSSDELFYTVMYTVDPKALVVWNMQ